ncbi:MAG: SDR family oxidoreductase [Gemmatimonadetes bacterium]|nr:SDR family oxidoreductase [Gemmatimonadota bacterium]
MTSAHSIRRTIAALAVGVTLGAVASAGIALLLYTGQGFLRAAGLLVSSTLMAVAAGLWAGAPESSNLPAGARAVPAGAASGPRGEALVSTTGRWLGLLAALVAGGLFTAFWSAQPPLREVAWAGAFAVLLVLALPAYSAGTLLAALHARDRGPGASAVASASMAGSAFGILLAATVIIPAIEPWSVFYGGAALLAVASILDRGPSRVSPVTGVTHMTDRVVIVTGAADSGQLGHTIARTFVDAGARVVISGRTAAITDAAASLAPAGEVLAVQADLTNDDDVARLIHDVREHFGRIDALINVAGGLSVIASVEDTTPAEWQREIERNAGTALRLSRAALPLLRESRGAIVNFAAPAASRAPARLAAYSAAKAAVVALTRSLAIEEKSNGVRVNAIAPGMMDTDQNRAEAGEDVTYVSRDDVAAVTLFLAGPGAAGVTGETVHVLGETIR